MHQERLNGLTRIPIGSELFDEADFESVVDDFVTKHVRKTLPF